MNTRSCILISLGLSLACGVAQEADTAVDTYQGPAVLSRGGASTAGQRAGRLIDFQFWGDVTGIYDSDMQGVSVGPGGLPLSVGEEGLEAGGGVVGSKTWRHDQISLDYKGDFRHYTPNTYFDGTDQLLQFDWHHVISRHLTFDVHEIGGITSLSYGDLAFVPLRDSDLVAVPQNQLFDQPTYFDETGGEIFWQKSARLSFGGGGEGFIIDRQSQALANMRGAQVRGDVVYRLTRRQKVYLTYELMKFDYQRAYGYSTAGTYAGGYSIDIGRRWTIEAQAGAINVHTLGLIQQPVDPAIAAIIGSGYTTITSNRDVYIPEGDLRLTRRFRRSAVDLGGAASVSPGNGVYLTSRADTAYVNYSVIGTNRLSFNSVVGYSSLSSVGQQVIGRFAAINGGGGATYRIRGNLHAELRYDFYHYTTQNDNYRKNENRVSIGIAFSSGERPLAIW